MFIRPWNYMEQIWKVILSKRFKSKQALAFTVLFSVTLNLLSLAMPKR